MEQFSRKGCIHLVLFHSASLHIAIEHLLRCLPFNWTKAFTNTTYKIEKLYISVTVISFVSFD